MAEHPGKHIHSAGMGLEWSNDSGHSWTAINDLLEVDSPPMKRGRVPDSTLQTPYKVKRKKPGWIEPGEPNFSVALTAAQLAVLFAFFFNGDTLLWREFYPAAYDASHVGYLQYSAFIGDLQPGQGMQRDQDELIQAKLTLVITEIDPSFFSAAGTGTIL